MPTPYQPVTNLSDEQVRNIALIRSSFEALDAVLREIMPSSRYTSLALTALEQAAMWAVKAVTHG